MGLQANASMITRLQGLKGRALAETVFTPMYGRLYNHFSVEDAKGLAPDGWRIPTYSDWYTELHEYILNNIDTGEGVGRHVRNRRHNGTPSATGYNTDVHPRWDFGHDDYGLDTVNFSIVGGGTRFTWAFNDIGSYAGFWEAGIMTEAYAARWGLSYAGTTFTRGVNTTVANRKNGNSVKCVRDASASELLLADGTLCDDLLDLDNNLYNTVKIGNRVWTVQNLSTTKYKDGTSIPHVTGDAAWADLTTGAYCNYDNDENWVFASIEWFNV